MDHGGRQVGPGALHQRTRNIRGASQAGGHAVGVVEVGQQIDDLVHRHQALLSSAEVAVPKSVQHPPAQLPDRFAKTVQVRHRVDLEVRWRREGAAPEKSSADRGLRVFLGRIVDVAAVEYVGVVSEDRLHLMQGGPGPVHKLVGRLPLPAVQRSNGVGRRPDDFPALDVPYLAGRELRIEFDSDRLRQLIELEGVHALSISGWR